MCLYTFFFGKPMFQLVKMSFMSPIWPLFHVNRFSQPTYNPSFSLHFFNRNIQPEKYFISRFKISYVYLVFFQFFILQTIYDKLILLSYQTSIQLGDNNDCVFGLRVIL